MYGGIPSHGSYFYSLPWVLGIRESLGSSKCVIIKKIFDTCWPVSTYFSHVLLNLALALFALCLLLCLAHKILEQWWCAPKRSCSRNTSKINKYIYINIFYSIVFFLFCVGIGTSMPWAKQLRGARREEGKGLKCCISKENITYK